MNLIWVTERYVYYNLVLVDLGYLYSFEEGEIDLRGEVILSFRHWSDVGLSLLYTRGFG